MTWDYMTDGMRDVVLRAAGNHSKFFDLKSLDKATAYDLVRLDANELPHLTPKGAAYLVDERLLDSVPPSKRERVSRLARRM